MTLLLWLVKHITLYFLLNSIIPCYSCFIYLRFFVCFNIVLILLGLNNGYLNEYIGLVLITEVYIDTNISSNVTAC